MKISAIPAGAHREATLPPRIPKTPSGATEVPSSGLRKRRVLSGVRSTALPVAPDGVFGIRGAGRWRRVVSLVFPLLLLALPACAQKMATQPSPRPLAPSDFFADGRASRPPVEGTVARGQLRTDRPLYEGTDKDGKYVTDFPFEVNEQVLQRGKQRYDVFCSVCHGLTGQGDGRIVQRGFTKPPSLTKDPSRGYLIKSEGKEKILLTDVPVGYVYHVVTKGYGAMPDYAEQIPTKDRWAIVAYVRALQYSQASEAEKAKMLETRKGDKK